MGNGKEVQLLVEMSLDDVAETIEQMEITEKMDLGNALIFTGAHPQYGNIVVFNNATGKHAMYRQ